MTILIEKSKLILAWVKKNWILLSIVAAIIIGVYATARYLQPARVVEKTKEVVKVEYKEKIEYRDKVKIQKVTEVQKANDKHTETTTIKKPDGTETTHTIVNETSHTEAKTNETKVEVKYVDRVVEKQIEKVIEKEKIIEAKKNDWMVGVQVGYDIYGALDDTPQLIPQMNRVSIGVDIERRIVGPFYLGVWGNTAGNAGLSVNISW